MERIADLSQSNRTLGLVTRTQSRIADLQNQIASGHKSLDYKGIARNSERLVTLESAHARVSQYIEGNELIERRLGTMEASVAQIFDLMSEFKSLIVNGLNADNASDLDLTNRSQQMLNQVAALLNVQEDGRYLFSGSRTATLPVNVNFLPTSYTIPTTDGDSSSYFRGDNLKFTLRADDNFDIAYNIDASETGFERAIRALDVMAKAPLTTDRPTLDHVLGVVTNAIDDIANIRTRLGTTRKTLDEVNERHREFLLFTEQTINTLQNVDVAEAVTRMNDAQVTLEASFLTLSRLSQLTLVKFIR